MKMLSFLFSRRSRKKYSRMCLTAALLIGALMAPCAWAAGETVGSSTPLYDAVQNTKNAFLNLYKIAWDECSMDSELEGAIRGAVENELNGKNPLSAGVDVIEHKYRVINAVVERTAEKFNEAYNGFLNKLQTSFSEEYAAELASYYQNELANMIGTVQKPLGQEYINAQSRELLAKKAAKLKENVEIALKELLPDRVIWNKETGVLAISIGAFWFREELGRFLAKEIGAKAATSAAGKQLAQTLTKATTLVSVILIAYTTYDLANTVIDAPNKLREQLKTHYFTQLKEEAPQAMWEMVDPSVTESFKATKKLLQKVLSSAEKFANDAEVLRLTQDLSNDKKVEFCNKLATIAVDKEADFIDENFYKDFGNAILNADMKTFSTLYDLISNNRAVARQWFELVDQPQEILKMFQNMQPETREKFAPTQESLDVLRWAFEMLKDSERVKAFNLDYSYISWIKDGIPRQYIALLLDSQHSSVDVMGEIEKLKKIPDKEDRRPWQSGAEGLFSRYRRKIEIVVCFIAVFFGVGILASLRNLLFGKKRRRKK